MLISTVFSRRIKAQIPTSFQWINITVRLNSTSSSSSDSSDSSDSDSDTKKNLQRESNSKAILKAKQKTEGSEDKLQHLLNVTKKKSFVSKYINVAINPKKREARKTQTQVPYIKQLAEAARNTAKFYKGDRQKTASDLINKAAFIQERNQPVQERSIINQLLAERKEKQPDKPWHHKQSVIYQLKAKQYQSEKRATENKKQSSLKRSHQIFEKLISTETPIFREIAAPSQDIPTLKTWQLLEEREMKLLVTNPPRTYFQELIQWTNEGKLWKFPIDNEQGMEKEHSVHFSEHVFMERHLQGWCPKKGPVRHFMELVCTGLSKNPYMTVEEKVEHIMWYKEYFASKEKLLQELGAIEAPKSTPTEQINA